jgi:hypothetical protein
MILKKISKLSMLFTALFTLTFAMVPVYALGAADDGAAAAVGSSAQTEDSVTETQSDTSTVTKKEQARQRAEAKREEANAKRLAAQEQAKSGRSEAQKLAQCKRKEKTINQIMVRIADRGQKQMDLFSTIATRVEDFYTKSGRTADNYDALVAAVNSSKADAQTTVTDIKTTSVSFKCDGSESNSAGQAFKASLKSEIQALKDYKTAVKNLIVGVKSVQSDNANTTGGVQ